MNKKHEDLGLEREQDRIPLDIDGVLTLKKGDNISSLKYLMGGFARLLKNPKSEKLKDGTDAIILSVRHTLSEHGLHDFELVVRSSEYKTGMIGRVNVDAALRNAVRADREYRSFVRKERRKQKREQKSKEDGAT